MGTDSVGFDPEGGLYRTHLPEGYRCALLWVSYLQGVRMIADFSHECGARFALPPQYNEELSRHSRIVMVHTLGLGSPCSCHDCTDDKRRLIYRGGFMAVRSMRFKLISGVGIQT